METIDTKQFTFGITYVLFNKEKIGIRFPVSPRHDVKSIAGTEFANNPQIKSATVFDPTGKRHLYLRKLETGEVVTREEAE